MSTSQEDHALSLSFDMKDYVDATNDAARRTRTITIVMVVASVLLGISWYNSMRSSWQLYRLRQAFDSDPKYEYVKRFLDFSNHPNLLTEEKDGKSAADKFRDDLRQESVKAYVENVRFIKAPFFGIAFDVNDLGLLGGAGLIIILLMMRYSLSREIKNLNVTFREAVHHDQLPAFYHALAMRQVFTVPHMKGEKRNRWLAASPRMICILPGIVFVLGVTYDYYSTIGPSGVYSFRLVSFTLIIETFCLGLIIYLCARCWERQGHIDAVWQRYWSKLEGQRTSVIKLKNDLIKQYGSDEDVDKALRSLQPKPEAV